MRQDFDSALLSSFEVSRQQLQQQFDNQDYDNIYNDALNRYFGHSKFRPGQLEAIQAVLQGDDVAIYFSTGSGKSMCYILPAIITGKITLVVSPLISLMADQCRNINNTAGSVFGRDIACFLGTGQTDPTVADRAFRGEFLLVYVTPERLVGSLAQFAELTQRCEIGLLAVDESHCCSQWGHDFRPSYKCLGDFRGHPSLSRIPIMALTATAGQKVRTDIQSILRLGRGRSCKVLTNSVDRPNLHISVVSEYEVTACRPLLYLMMITCFLVLVARRHNLICLTYSADYSALLLSTLFGFYSPRIILAWVSIHLSLKLITVGDISAWRAVREFEVHRGRLAGAQRQSWIDHYIRTIGQ
jgi:hypothetical protein